MLIVYLSFLVFDEKIFTELFCILLGVTGILACNHLTLFLRSSESARLSEHVFLPAFLALFRMLLQLGLIRGRSASSNVLLMFVAAVFFCGYATVDARASFDRALLFADAETERMIVLLTEALLINSISHRRFCWALVVFSFDSFTRVRRETAFCRRRIDNGRNDGSRVFASDLREDRPSFIRLTSWRPHWHCSPALGRGAAL
jgi:hypothetical protein